MEEERYECGKRGWGERKWERRGCDLDLVVGEVEPGQSRERVQILDRVDLIIGQVEHSEALCGGGGEYRHMTSGERARGYRRR